MSDAPPEPAGAPAVAPVAAALVAAIGWFIPEAVRDHVDLLRARLYVVYSFLVAANAATFGVLHVAHHVPGTDGTVVYVLAGICAVSLGLPFLLRLGWPLPALGRLFTVFFLGALVAIACYDGGLGSGAAFWLVVAPLAAALLGGPRLGAAAGAAAAAAGLALFGASAAGVAFPSSLSPEDAALHAALNFAACVACVAALAWLYEGPMVRHFRELSDRLAAANARLQDELVERQRAQRRAEAAVRAKDALLGNMSHEFRTPLTAILSGTELLLAEADGDDRPVLQTVDRGARRLLGTLDGVLHLTALESGGGRLAPAPVDVRAAAEAAAGPLRPVARAKGLRLVVRGAAAAEADPDALRRALGALVDNAVRFTERGAVAVVVRDGPGGPAVEVADTGVGMSADFLARAFEPFRQASEGEARTHEGSGIGLTLARRLVELMGGAVSVESAPGRGTRVRVRLPAPGALPAVTAGPVAEPDVAPAADLAA